MQDFEIFHQSFWKPLSYIGLTGNFWNINKNTIIFTWVVLGLLFLISLACYYVLTKRRDGIAAYIINSLVKTFKDLVEQTIGYFSFKHFAFITSMFTFIFFCNIIALIPWIEEPTTDVSTTLALGIISFVYVQVYAIKTGGLKEYVKEFFAPFFLLFPLNVISELAKIVSISFRLFGNIFGGSIISRLWTSAIGGKVLLELLGILSGLNILIFAFFVIFEGFIQAFVFSMLTLTYLSMALGSESED